MDKLSISEKKIRCGHSPSLCEFWIKAYCQCPENSTKRIDGITYPLALNIEHCKKPKAEN